MTRETPERCGQRYLIPGTGEAYTCDLAADHRSPFHYFPEANATWSTAGDLEHHAGRAAALLRAAEPVSLQYDACGARLHVDRTSATREARDRPQVDATHVCALGMAHGSMAHRSADGVQWEAAHHPDTAGTMMDVQSVRRYHELLRLAAPGEDGALNLGPIIERCREAKGGNAYAMADSLSDVEPLVREVMRLRREARDSAARNPHADPVPAIRDLSEMLRIFVDTRCTGCPIVANSSNPEDGADIEPQPNCPVHGEVAELRRSLAWAAGQHERITLALGPEYTAPFGSDAAQAAVNCIKTARGIDAVLREAGIDYPLGLRGVEDLANLHEGALEHVEELRAAVRAEIVANIHRGHSVELDDCTHHACVGLRKAAAT